MSSLDDFEVILRATQALKRVIHDEVEETVECEVDRRVESRLRRDVYPLIAGIEGRLTSLGEIVSNLTDAVANIRGAVGETVNKLDELADRVKGLEGGSAEAESVASDLNALADNLRDANENPDLPDADSGNGENPNVPAQPGESGDVSDGGGLPGTESGSESADGGVDSLDGEGNPQPGQQNA